MRSPDISWIQNERWQALNNDEKEVFAPICPDFILEILSLPEEAAYVHEKMKEYIECGAQLGWLIDYINSSVYIYNSDGGVTFIDSLKVKLSGDPVLPGFVLDLESLIN
ncbi:Uma2 family endonuclease [Dyadobacter sp. CY345]|nr:Uma2 family endonuclease [Dyadobacter sp. CY345]